MLPFYGGPEPATATPSLIDLPDERGVLRALARQHAGLCRASQDVPEHYKPRAIIYVAPPVPPYALRRQAGRRPQPQRGAARGLRLQPLSGPLAQRRACYSVLLDIGEHEGWVCCHTQRPRWSRRRMKTRSSSCTRARPAAARAKCSRISSARPTDRLLHRRRTRSRARNII